MERHAGPYPRQTRIVATIGLRPDDRDWPTFLDGLVEAGVDVLRLNMSHADKGYAKEEEILAWAARPTPNGAWPTVAALVDLQGPKARIGVLPDGDLTLAIDDRVVLQAIGAGVEALAADERRLPRVPMPKSLATGLLRALAAMRRQKADAAPEILFGDGDIVMQLESLHEGGAVARVTAGGVLGSRKGLTVRGADLDLDAFPDKDQADLRFALAHGAHFIAVSFVRGPSDIERVQRFIEAHTPQGFEPPRVIAKIETLAAVRRIESILEVADGIMIARGDLGLQLGVEEIPLLQKRLVQRARECGKPAIVATQMLESMITNPAPTRAEATDVFNAILDGGDAIMLSGETSVGRRPAEVIRTMDRIARLAETYRREPEWLKRDRKAIRAHARARATDPFIGRINEEFALTAVQFAEHIPAKAVVSFTRSGGTPRRLSRYRPGVPLLAMCGSERIARRLLLHYGVHPIVLRDFDADKHELGIMIDAARDLLRSDLGLTPGDALVVTAGQDWPRGGTNVIRVIVEDIEAAREQSRSREPPITVER